MTPPAGRIHTRAADRVTEALADRLARLMSAAAVAPRTRCGLRLPLVPHRIYKWYCKCMSGTYQVVMSDRGRLVIPADLRERTGLTEGTALVFETPTGLVLLTRPQLQELVRADLAGLDLVGELLAERRAEAAAEDAA